MASNLDWSQCPAVESVPEVIEQFDVTREQINAVLDFIAESLRAPRPLAQERPRRCSFSLITARREDWPALS